jgi:hypothetical protein
VAVVISASTSAPRHAINSPQSRLAGLWSALSGLEDPVWTNYASATELTKIGFRAAAEPAERGGVPVGERVMRSQFIGGSKRLAASDAAKFLEVKLAAVAPAACTVCDPRVEVVLRNGRSLRVEPGFDSELVRALAALLESPFKRWSSCLHHRLSNPERKPPQGRSSRGENPGTGTILTSSGFKCGNRV